MGCLLALSDFQESLKFSIIFLLLPSGSLLTLIRKREQVREAGCGQRSSRTTDLILEAPFCVYNFDLLKSRQADVSSLSFLPYTLIIFHILMTSSLFRGKAVFLFLSKGSSFTVSLMSLPLASSLFSDHLTP